MIVGNLLFIIWDTDSEAMIVGRLLIGIAHGTAYVALITQAGENASKTNRGNTLSTVNCMLYFGIFISVLITGTVRLTWFGLPVTISGERIIGIIGIIIAVASIACTITLTVETVPFLLRRNDREHALTNLKHLRGTTHETYELMREMEELESMVVEDRQQSCNIFTNGNARPLALMIIMRLMVALTNNFLINVVTFSFVFQVFYGDQFRIVPLVVVAPRLTMSILQIFYADLIPRKVQIIVSSASAAIILILIGILVNTLRAYSFWDLHVFSIVYTVFWLTFQFVCGMGMDQMQDVYLSEAFSTAKKPLSMAFVTGIEHLFHIFMIGMFFVGDYFGLIIISSQDAINAIVFTAGAMVILFGIILVLALPETRRMSLKQAKDAFINHSVNIASPFA